MLRAEAASDSHPSLFQLPSSIHNLFFNGLDHPRTRQGIREDLGHGDKSAVLSHRSLADRGRLLTIGSMMALRRRQPPRLLKANTERGAYTLVVRGPDGRLQCERFDDAATYLARLMALQRSSAESVSIEDILALLDA
jgi:hypothetical protein